MVRQNIEHLTVRFPRTSSVAVTRTLTLAITSVEPNLLLSLVRFFSCSTFFVTGA